MRNLSVKPLFLVTGITKERKNERGHSEQTTIGIIKERDEVIINNYVANIYLDGDHFSANAVRIPRKIEIIAKQS